MKVSLIILVVFGFQHTALATPQHPDTLIYKGASYSVYGFEFDEKPKPESEEHARQGLVSLSRW